MSKHSQMLKAKLRLFLFAIALSTFIFYSTHVTFISTQKYQSFFNEDFSRNFYKVVNSNNEKLIRSFINENSEKYRTETNRLIGASLKYKHEKNLAEAEKSINLAKKAAALLKIYYDDEYYSNLIQFCSSLSKYDISLRLKAHRLYKKGLKDYANGNFSKAFNKFREAEEIYEIIEDKFSICRIHHNLGNIYFYRSYYDKSLKEYEKSLQFAKTIKDKRAEIQSIMASGLIYSKIGNYSKALKHFKIALNESTNDSSGLYERYVMNYIASIYYKLGAYDTSSQIYNTALQKSINANDKTMQVSIIKNIGINLIKQNNFKESERYLLKCLKINSKSIKATQHCEILNSLAFINIKKGDTKKALKYLEKCLKLGRKIENPIILADSLNMLGEAYMKLKEYEKAHTNFQECLKLCENIDSPYLICRFYRNSALLSKHQNKFNKAEKQFLQAIDLIEKKRGGIEEDSLKSSYLSTIKDIYEDMILLQIEDLDNPISALHYSERSRARAFLDILGGKAEIIFSEKNLQIEKKPTKQEYSDISSSYTLRGPNNTSPLSSEFKKIEDKVTEISSPLIITPFHIEEIQKSLHNNCKIVEYEIAREKTIIWVISKDEIKSQIISLSSKELKDAIINFRNALTLHDNFLKQYKTWPERLKVTDRLAVELYTMLFEPIRKFLTEGDLLYIIPDDELFYIPFAPLKSQQGKHIIEDFELAYIPSASILKLCLEKDNGRISLEKDKILLVGNPLISQNVRDYFPDLNPLLYAEKEINAISKLFPNSLTLSGKEAKENRIIATLKNFEIIHFASHSLIDERMPLYSSIILSPSPDSSKRLLIENPEDGLLMLPEIFSLNLSQAKLVVLSSCDTALGKLVKGEGIIGLSRAFMYAGTPSLLSSLWKIEDKSTCLLFQKFYENFRKVDSSKAQALRYSQLSFIKNEEYQEYKHPFFWSSFLILGDGR